MTRWWWWLWCSDRWWWWSDKMVMIFLSCYLGCLVYFLALFDFFSQGGHRASGKCRQYSQRSAITSFLSLSFLGLASSPYVTSTVSSSVKVCQSDKVLILPTIRFFWFFCIKLAFYKRFKVTKPDFRKNNYLGLKWPKMVNIGPKFGFWPFYGDWVISFC